MDFPNSLKSEKAGSNDPALSIGNRTIYAAAALRSISDSKGVYSRFCEVATAS
jgi:hypothetical protein